MSTQQRSPRGGTATIAAGVVALGLACGQAPGPEPAGVPRVKVVTVQDRGAEVLELRGSVTPEGRLNLGFKLAGVIASVQVREGERVRAGQTLAVLDEVDAQAQARSAKAALERARRESAQAERLVEEGILARNQRDDARNQLESAEALWRQAQDALARTRLASPVAGTVFRRLAEPGETVGAGTPVLVVDTTAELVVKTGVAERDLQGLAVGLEVMLFPEDGGKPFPGVVKRLGASPGTSDGLYGVDILPARQDLRSGSLLKIRLPRAAEQAGSRLPFSALVHRLDQDYVFVLDGAGRGVNARLVHLAKADGRSVIVDQGLKPGERIVAEGASFLEDGQPVQVLE